MLDTAAGFPLRRARNQRFQQTTRRSFRGLPRAHRRRSLPRRVHPHQPTLLPRNVQRADCRRSLHDCGNYFLAMDEQTASNLTTNLNSPCGFRDSRCSASHPEIPQRGSKVAPASASSVAFYGRLQAGVLTLNPSIRNHVLRHARNRRFRSCLTHANRQQSVRKHRDTPLRIYLRSQCHHAERPRRAQNRHLPLRIALVALRLRTFTLAILIALAAGFARAYHRPAPLRFRRCNCPRRNLPPRNRRNLLQRSSRRASDPRNPRSIASTHPPPR